MQIVGVAGARRLKILGRIGLGVTVPVLDKKTKEPVKLPNGEIKTRPQATDHFVVPAEVAKALGDDVTPTQIPIKFEQNQLADVFPTALMLFRGNGDLICMGDGKQVTFRRHVAEDHSTTPVVYDRLARWDLIEEMGLPAQWVRTDKTGYGTAERIGTTGLKCLHMECPRLRRLWCKPTGKLRFCIEGIVRQGYYQMTVHLNPMRELITQIEDGRQWVQNRTGQPRIVSPVKWLLTLTGPTERWMNAQAWEDGKPVIKKQLIKNIYTPELELDPVWMEALEAGDVEFPPMVSITADEVYGAEPELDKTLLDPEPYVESSNDEDDDIEF